MTTIFIEKNATALTASELTPYNHTDVADMCYRLYNTTLKCSNIKDNIWYFFNGTCWKITPMCKYLTDQISNEVVDLIAQKRISLFCMKLQILEPTIENVHDKVMLRQRMALLSKLEINCGKRSFKNLVVNSARKIFYDKDFNTLLNE
jgi:hypothetical protein